MSQQTLRWYTPGTNKKILKRKSKITELKRTINDSFDVITPLLIELYNNCKEFESARPTFNSQTMYKDVCKFYRKDNNIKSRILKVLFQIVKRHTTNPRLSAAITRVFAFTTFRKLEIVDFADFPVIAPSPRCLCELNRAIFREDTIETDTLY